MFHVWDTGRCKSRYCLDTSDAQSIPESPENKARRGDAHLQPRQACRAGRGPAAQQRPIGGEGAGASAVPASLRPVRWLTGPPGGSGSIFLALPNLHASLSFSAQQCGGWVQWEDWGPWARPLLCPSQAEGLHTHHTSCTEG